VHLLTERLKAAGQIRAQYSADDLSRFALRVYSAKMRATKKALRHAFVTATEISLRSMGLEEETA
jgi:hypothetical protein